MALFGEKYGDKVRVIQYGSSIELCGGTHVENTGNIGMIKIVSESSIAAGIRRIEAITGANVEDTMYQLKDTLSQISALLNNAPNVIPALQKSLAENADLRKQAEEFLQERIKNQKAELLEKAENINGLTVVSCSGARIADVVKGIAFALKADNLNDTVFIAATHENGKPMLTVQLSDNLVKDGMNASAMVREAAKLIKGGGGGQPHFAQAGGKDMDGLSAAMEKMRELLKH
jgi:alanyl-tRNA synthetase